MKIKKLNIINTLVITTMLLTASHAAYAAGKKVNLQSVVKVKKVLCGLKKGVNQKSYSPVKKIKGAYYPDSNKASKKTCAKLVRSSLKNIPSSKNAVSTNSSSGVGAKFTGTPPLITGLPNSDITQIFWRPGIISAVNSGSPSQDQCLEYSGRGANGTSAGEGACFLTQNVAQTFEQVLQAGTSLCYMRNMASANVINSGAVSVVKGSAPNGSLENIFETPLGANRLVKIAIPTEEGSENIFISVNGSNQNSSKGLSYGVKLWFCSGNQTQAQESETITVSNENVMRHVSLGKQGGFTGTSSVSAKLIKDGSNLNFDPAAKRTVTYIGGNSNFSSKSELSIDPSGRMDQKLLGSDSIKLYGIANFIGSSLSTARLTSGGYKFQTNTEAAKSQSIEWLDSFYALFTDSTILNELAQVDFSTDTFYSSLNITEPDFSDLSCSANADIELSLNMFSEAMVSVAQECEGERLQGGGFCFDTDALRQARQNASQACNFN
jgi:hypothetical protein